MGLSASMRPIVFTCPITRSNVQHFSDDSETSGHENRYEPVECPACARLHYVNVTNGKVLGEK
jgi:hypothetical protein